MVSDSGSALDFSYSDLTESDLKAIAASPLVALLCLNHNKNAPKLAEELFSMVHHNSKALTFMDMGDPSSNPSIVEPMAKKVVSEGLVDILGMNENEAGWFARAITGRTDSWRDTPSHPEKWLSVASLVSHETGTRIDFHTPYFTATIEDDAITAMPTFEVPVMVTCGAGDAWNAGDIFGTLVGLRNEDRLLLSNSVAALYVSSASAAHPTRQAVIQFLKGKQALSSVGSKLIRPV
jgi:sugar/nucleoside kinase (ribokinase family)